MNHLAGSIAKLSQGRENWYIGREGIPVDGSSGEKCEPVIVFEGLDLSPLTNGILEIHVRCSCFLHLKRLAQID